jgi:hypothetical protein
MSNFMQYAKEYADTHNEILIENGKNELGEYVKYESGLLLMCCNSSGLPYKTIEPPQLIGGFMLRGRWR